MDNGQDPSQQKNQWKDAFVSKIGEAERAKRRALILAAIEKRLKQQPPPPPPELEPPVDPSVEEERQKRRQQMLAAYERRMKEAQEQAPQQDAPPLLTGPIPRGPLARPSGPRITTLDDLRRRDALIGHGGTMSSTTSSGTVVNQGNGTQTITLVEPPPKPKVLHLVLRLKPPEPNEPPVSSVNVQQLQLQLEQAQRPPRPGTRETIDAWYRILKVIIRALDHLPQDLQNLAWYLKDELLPSEQELHQAPNDRAQMLILAMRVAAVLNRVLQAMGDMGLEGDAPLLLGAVLRQLNSDGMREDVLNEIAVRVALPPVRSSGGRSAWDDGYDEKEAWDEKQPDFPIAPPSGDHDELEEHDEKESGANLVDLQVTDPPPDELVEEPPPVSVPTVVEDTRTEEQRRQQEGYNKGLKQLQREFAEFYQQAKPVAVQAKKKKISLTALNTAAGKLDQDLKTIVNPTREQLKQLRQAMGELERLLWGLQQLLNRVSVAQQALADVMNQVSDAADMAELAGADVSFAHGQLQVAEDLLEAKVGEGYVEAVWKAIADLQELVEGLSLAVQAIREREALERQRILAAKILRDGHANAEEAPPQDQVTWSYGATFGAQVGLVNSNGQYGPQLAQIIGALNNPAHVSHAGAMVHHASLQKWHFVPKIGLYESYLDTEQLGTGSTMRCWYRVRFRTLPDGSTWYHFTILAFATHKTKTDDPQVLYGKMSDDDNLPPNFPK